MVRRLGSVGRPNRALVDPPSVLETDDETDVLRAANRRLRVPEDHRPGRARRAGAASARGYSLQRLLRREDRSGFQLHDLENRGVGDGTADVVIHVAHDDVVDHDTAGNRYHAVDRHRTDVVAGNTTRTSPRYPLCSRDRISSSRGQCQDDGAADEWESTAGHRSPVTRNGQDAGVTAVKTDVVTRDQVVWGFGPEMEPVLEVEPGAVVTFETNDCFTGQIQSESDLVTEIDFDRVNGATGPVALQGAEPGDSLIVEILEVKPVASGVATIIPGFGQLIGRVRSPVTQMFQVAGETVQMNERISFPLRPMVGVVGVATDGETISNAFAGRHGGNRDNHLHGPGSRIYFPVRQPGGMFAVGDMHAAMGDGEICFTGVEIAGEVDIRFDLAKGKQARWPVTELADRWLLHATAERYEEALQLVSEEAARLLVDEHGFTPEDAFIFLSVACDAGVAQACKPCEGFGTIARFSIPKIDACPAPFSP